MIQINSSYDRLETAIVEKLKPLADAGIEVISSPDTDAEYNDNGKAFERPRITVMYSMSEFDNQPIKGIPQSFAMGVVKQTEYAELTLNFQARKRKGPNGLFSVYEDARKIILGFRPKGWGRIFIKENLYVERSKDTNVWFYALSLVCKREIIQCEDENLNLINSSNVGLQSVFPDEPLLKEVNFETMAQFQTVSLEELQQQGFVLTDLSDDALIYVSEGTNPFVIPWGTFKTLIASTGSTSLDFEVSFNGTFEKAILQGRLIEKIVIIPSASGTVRIGTSLNGEQILMDETVVSGEALPIAIDFYIADNSTLYMSGPACTIKYYVR